MTVIAWDGETIAVDSQETNNGLICYVNKLFKHNDTWMVCTGWSSEVKKLMRWFRDGADYDNFPATPNGSTLYTVDAQFGLSKYQNDPEPHVIGWDIWSDGSGRDFAISALYCGKSAIEAVKIGIKYQNGCGGAVKSAKVIKSKKSKAK